MQELSRKLKRRKTRHSKEDDSEVDSLDHEDNEAEFEVEAVTDQRVTRGGVTELRVQWKGYPESDATWEPEGNLEHCHAEVRAFEMTRVK